MRPRTHSLHCDIHAVDALKTVNVLQTSRCPSRTLQDVYECLLSGSTSIWTTELLVNRLLVGDGARRWALKRGLKAAATVEEAQHVRLAVAEL